MIELRNVTVKYGDLTALEDVTLSVHEGEFFTIVGPNGSGKTTMLRVMAGLEYPTRGEVRFRGKKIDKSTLEMLRAKSTLVFQKTVMFNTSVFKNVAYGLKARGFSEEEIRRRVREALKVVKLEGFEDRHAKALSGGEQQRVSLARAMVLGTELLLLDEPTANLDPKNASIIEEAIAYIRDKKGVTVVMSTHNMFQARRLAERVAVIIDGKIRHIGYADEVFGEPSDYLASFARLENLFSGSARSLEDGTSVVDIGGVEIVTVFPHKGKVTLFIRPEDIILSRKPIISSARNSFKGKITEISDLGNLVRLRVEAGRKFTVQITKRSFIDMNLNLGEEVFLAFKASSVRVV